MYNDILLGVKKAQQAGLKKATAAEINQYIDPPYHSLRSLGHTLVKLNIPILYRRANLSVYDISLEVKLSSEVEHLLSIKYVYLPVEQYQELLRIRKQLDIIITSIKIDS